GGAADGLSALAAIAHCEEPHIAMAGHVPAIGVFNPSAFWTRDVDLFASCQQDVPKSSFQRQRSCRRRASGLRRTNFELAFVSSLGRREKTMKLPHRRQFMHLAAGAAALPAMSRIARAQAYPIRPITMVVPFPAGGSTDTLARI